MIVSSAENVNTLETINLAANLADVRNRISKARINEGLQLPALVAVSKRQPDERIEAALAAGQRVFGENRVQEAQERWASRRSIYPDLRLHLIGPLQTNKVADAVALFDVIEVVDRPKLARSLSTEMFRQGRRLSCYVQVNTGEEDQKSGILPDEADSFIGFCREECDLDIAGLMCIPPVDEEPAMHFALLRTIAERNGLSGLSMGMSGDYEEAVRFGATSVRVGSAIFGLRDS
jgi:pyridoxal phosphate enzyme (YggS family)